MLLLFVTFHPCHKLKLLGRQTYPNLLVPTKRTKNQTSKIKWQIRHQSDHQQTFLLHTSAPRMHWSSLIAVTLPPRQQLLWPPLLLPLFVRGLKRCLRLGLRARRWRHWIQVRRVPRRRWERLPTNLPRRHWWPSILPWRWVELTGDPGAAAAEKSKKIIWVSMMSMQKSFQELKIWEYRVNLKKTP